MPVTSVSRVIRAPREGVWALLSEISQSRRWNKYWRSIDFLTNQTHGPGTRFSATTESGETFVFDVCDWEAPQRIAFCPVREPGERYSITLDSHLFEIHPLSEGESELVITARASASGVRGRVLSLFFWAGHQKEGLNAALDAIQAIFEPTTEADGNSASETQEAIRD